MSSGNGTRWLQIALITVGAAAVYFTMRELPTGTNLHNADFAVPGQGQLEFCDPANPQFIPVTTAKSPVTLTLAGDTPAVTGRETHYVLTLKTWNGQDIGPADLLVSQTQKIHLLVADPSLQDYQHIHPTPGEKNGEWLFSLTPRLGGHYRVYADFTPVVTSRSLYAATDLQVAGPTSTTQPALSWDFEEGDYRFHLSPASPPMRVRQQAELTFTVTRKDGGNVPLGTVMGAYAHLVVFDAALTGFAHVHPQQTDLFQKPDALKPALTFKLTIPNAGRFVIWAEVNLDGRLAFAPFWFDVVP
ncbi:MAG TPA: hypothetical protein VL357_11840 [Rariglobus sp.]|jgi:hypothetical protein|nr:hypothetical protein [Rariglobus sp.]